MKVPSISVVLGLLTGLLCVALAAPGAHTVLAQEWGVLGFAERSIHHWRAAAAKRPPRPMDRLALVEFLAAAGHQDDARRAFDALETEGLPVARVKRIRAALGR